MASPLTARHATTPAAFLNGGELTETKAAIREVERKVACCEAALEGRGSYLGIKDPAVVLDQLKTLQRKEEQLRETHLIYLRACAFHQTPSPASFPLGLPSSSSSAAASAASPSAHVPASLGAAPRPIFYAGAARGFVDADAAALRSVISVKSLSLHEALGMSQRSSSSAGATDVGSPSGKPLESPQQSLSWIGRHALYRTTDPAKNGAPARAPLTSSRAFAVRKGSDMESARGATAAATEHGVTPGRGGEVGARRVRAVAADKSRRMDAPELHHPVGASARQEVVKNPAITPINGSTPGEARDSKIMKLEDVHGRATYSSNGAKSATVTAAKGTAVTEPGAANVDDCNSDNNSSMVDLDVGSNGAGSLPPVAPSSTAAAAADDAARHDSDATATDDDIPLDEGARPTRVVAETPSVDSLPAAAAADQTHTGVSSGLAATSGAVEAVGQTEMIADKASEGARNVGGLVLPPGRPARKRRKSAEAGWRSRYSTDEFVSGGRTTAADRGEMLIKHEEAEMRGSKRGSESVERSGGVDKEWPETVDVGGGEDRLNRRRSGDSHGGDGDASSCSNADGTLPQSQAPKKFEPPNAWKKRCAFGDCLLAASFGPAGKQAIYCSAHKDPGMVNLTHRRCEEQGCMHQPSFNMEGEKKALFCMAHKKPGMVNVCSPRCASAGCVVRPSFGYLSDRKACYCDAHKLEGMTNVRKLRREPKTPTSQAPFSGCRLEATRTTHHVESEGAQSGRRSFLAEFRGPERGLSPPPTAGPIVSGFGDSTYPSPIGNGDGGEHDGFVSSAGTSSFLDAVSLAVGGDIR